MQRISAWARWALCACLLTITNPFSNQVTSAAEAQPKKSGKAKKAGKAGKAKKKIRGVRRCVDFKQSLAADEESVDLQLTNGCKFDILCSVEWEVQCSSPEGKRTEDESKEATTLGFSESWDLNASASACELDWEIKNVSWQCVAN
jgi:hypothetical protein